MNTPNSNRVYVPDRMGRVGMGRRIERPDTLAGYAKPKVARSGALLECPLKGNAGAIKP